MVSLHICGLYIWDNCDHLYIRVKHKTMIDSHFCFWQLICFWLLKSQVSAQITARSYNYMASSPLSDCLAGGVFAVSSKLECAAQCRQAIEVYTERGFSYSPAGECRCPINPEGGGASIVRQSSFVTYSYTVTPPDNPGRC